MQTHARPFRLSLIVALLLSTVVLPDVVDAAYRYRRQYYSSWSYRPARRYYYRRYNYYPTVRTRTYSYHYVIHFPSRPRYCYYYNPVRRVYWGRVEMDKDGKPLGYSLLAKKDRKQNLNEIDESAFPKPAEMPLIPDADDEIRIDELPNDIPQDPSDLPNDDTEL